MRRRELIKALGGTVMWPLALHAQAIRIARIGFLGLAPASSWSGAVDALRRGLRELGYVEGKNIVLEFRWATSVDELSILANEFVRMNVDILFAPASTQVNRPDEQPRPSRLYLPSMRTPLARVTLRALPIRAAISPVYRWFSPNLQPRASKS
jgi:hypothetical protein